MNERGLANLGLVLLLGGSMLFAAFEASYGTPTQLLISLLLAALMYMVRYAFTNLVKKIDSVSRNLNSRMDDLEQTNARTVRALMNVLQKLHEDDEDSKAVMITEELSPLIQVRVRVKAAGGEA